MGKKPYRVISVFSMTAAFSSGLMTKAEALIPQYVGGFRINWPAIILAFLCLALGALAIVYRDKYNAQKKNSLSGLRDSITGIGNLKYFDLNYQNTVSDRKNTQYHVAYIAFDYELIVGMFGFETYQEMMRFAAQNITGSLAEGDFAAVISQGAFAVMLKTEDKNEVTERLESLLDKLNKFDKKYKTELKAVFRCGVYKISSNEKKSENAIFCALQGYHHAERFKSFLVFFDMKMLLSDQNTLKYKKQIVDGMADNQFEPYLQMIIDTENNRVCGAELLTRWHHPEKGALMPGVYLDLIHQVDLTKEFDFYVFRKACEVVEELYRIGEDKFTVSCNFTQTTVSDIYFPDTIAEIASDYNFPHGNLVIEITEESIFHNRKTALLNIEKCRNMGFGIAIDDFGTGYTSFALLCYFPVNIVKLDRELLLAAEEERGGRLFNGIIELCHNMDMKVVCEGVETPNQDGIVKNAGGDFIQGYYYYKPLPFIEAKKSLIKERKRKKNQ